MGVGIVDLMLVVAVCSLGAAIAFICYDFHWYWSLLVATPSIASVVFVLYILYKIFYPQSGGPGAFD